MPRLWRTVGAFGMAAVAGASCAPNGIGPSGPDPTARSAEAAPVSTVCFAFAGAAVRVPVEVRHGWLVATASVDGQEGKFLVDTGCVRPVLLLPAFASRCRLTTRPAGPGQTLVDGAGGSIAYGLARVTAIGLGDARLDGVEATVADVRMFAHTIDGTGVDGVIGWPTFAGVLLTIDYSSGMLTLTRGQLPPVDGFATIGLRRVGDGLFVTASVAGRPADFCVDTGVNVGVTLPASSAGAVPWRSPTTTFASNNAFGPSLGTSGTLDGEVVIGSTHLVAPAVAVDPARSYGLLGAGVLDRFVVTFDVAGGRLQLGPDPPRAMAVFADLGFRYVGSTVTAVDAGGPIDGAGVRAGDQIISVNGQRDDPPWLAVMSGPGAIRGPALVNGGELGTGGLVRLGPGERMTVAPFDAVRPTGVEATMSGLAVTNWIAGDTRPLVIEFRRGGRTFVATVVGHPTHL